MTTHLLEFRVHDVRAGNLSNATVELGVNGGAVRTLSRAERAGLEVTPGNELSVRVSAPALWPVHVTLRVNDRGITRISADEKYMVLGLRGTSVGGGRHYVVAAWLSLFRDAEPDLVNRATDGTGDGPWEIPVPEFTYHSFLFDGPSVLSGQSSGGWGRFRGHVVTSQKSASEGTTHFLKTPGGSRLPQLSIAFVPHGTQIVSQRPPTLTFLIPKTGDIAHHPYPFHRAYGDVVTKYLVLKVKRVLNQLVGSGKKVICIMPVPHPAHYVGPLQNAATLERYLQEVVFHLRVKRGAGPRLTKLGRAAVAGFSAAGTPLLELMKGSLPSRKVFPELSEIYALDAISNRVTEMNARAASWLASGDRMLRIYIGQFEALGRQQPSFISGDATTSGAAREWSSGRGTWLFSPPEFWTQVRDEVASFTPATDYFPTTRAINKHQLHQIMPCLMLSHALATSAL